MEESRKSLESALADQEARFQREKEIMAEDLSDAKALLTQNGLVFHSRMSFAQEPRNLDSFAQENNKPAEGGEREARISGHGRGG